MSFDDEKDDAVVVVVVVVVVGGGTAAIFRFLLRNKDAGVEVVVTSQVSARLFYYFGSA
jgi:hypothetical protein